MLRTLRMVPGFKQTQKKNLNSSSTYVGKLEPSLFSLQRDWWWLGRYKPNFMSFLQETNTPTGISCGRKSDRGWMDASANCLLFLCLNWLELLLYLRMKMFRLSKKKVGTSVCSYVYLRWRERDATDVLPSPSWSFVGSLLSLSLSLSSIRRPSHHITTQPIRDERESFPE